MKLAQAGGRDPSPPEMTVISNVIENGVAIGPIHPLIRVHPGSGRRALYLGRRAGAWIVDMDVAHSGQLLDAIWSHIESRSLTWTHSWRSGDVLMWDNRCTMHRREAFDNNARRIMHRTQLAGDRP